MAGEHVLPVDQDASTFELPKHLHEPLTIGVKTSLLLGSIRRAMLDLQLGQVHGRPSIDLGIVGPHLDGALQELACQDPQRWLEGWTLHTHDEKPVRFGGATQVLATCMLRYCLSS